MTKPRAELPNDMDHSPGKGTKEKNKPCSLSHYIVGSLGCYSLGLYHNRAVSVLHLSVYSFIQTSIITCDVGTQVQEIKIHTSLRSQQGHYLLGETEKYTEGYIAQGDKYM